MRKRPSRNPKEESIQIAVSNYLRLVYPRVMFTSESSGIRLTMGQAMKAKKQRSQRGLPDMMIFEARGGFFGLMIELKRDGQSPFKLNGKLKAGEHLGEQFKVIQRLNSNGYRSTFATGFDQAREIIDHYMSLKKSNE